MGSEDSKRICIGVREGKEEAERGKGALQVVRGRAEEGGKGGGWKGRSVRVCGRGRSKREGRNEEKAVAGVCTV
eukprot:2368355-Pleurochrysis_carterae.AAC.4